MYTTLDAADPAACFAALARAFAQRDPVLLIIDGESVTLATGAGLRDAYGDDEETPIGIAAQATGHSAGLLCADAAMVLQADPAEAMRWLAVWLDPERFA